jgi:hypothetical protein
MIRRYSLVFGLMIGLMWMGEILYGNLGDTPILGNVRTLPEYRVVGWLFTGGALLFTMLSGIYAAHRTGDYGTALRVAVWSGLISGAIALVTLVGMTAIFLDALRHSPSDLAEFAKSGDPSFSHFLYMDALAGGVNHLWIGPALGLVLGSLGAVIGRALHPRTVDARSV